MKNTLTAASVLLPALLHLCSCLSQAAIWGRGKVPASWTQSPITVDGRLSDWPPGETYDSSGLRFRAINDGENLYLSVSAHEAGAKAILTGEIRQDVTLWFSDAKIRTWGLRLPFGALGVPLTNGMPSGSIMPELLKAEGTNISTSPLPANIEFGGEIPGRVPIYELKIPLAMLKTADNGIPLDFTTAYISAELEQQMKERFIKATAREPGQNSPRTGIKPQGGMSGRGGGKMGGGKHGGGGRGAARAQPEFPSPLEINLTVLPDARP